MEGPKKEQKPACAFTAENKSFLYNCFPITLHSTLSYAIIMSKYRARWGCGMANMFDYAKLIETRLWKCYERKSDDSRRKWIKDVYYNAIKQLSTVRDTFSNYTLHDKTHVINVMESMAGLLGDQIDTLTVGETELLMLAACLHDIGMAYTAEDKAKWLRKTAKCDEFIRKSDPNLMGTKPEDWTDSTRQNYFRWLHPFRVSEILEQAEWTQIFRLS